MCKTFAEKSFCPYGYKCRFAHGAQELVKAPAKENFRTKRCMGYEEHGFCLYGQRCQFSHEEKKWGNKAFLLGMNSILDI
jgi:hypothetical protein